MDETLVPVTREPIQVFISYARGTSTRDAQALHAAIGEQSFLDQSDLSPGDIFPARLADTLLSSRVVVVFADEAYFQSWYCGWELDAVLGPYAVALAARRDPVPYLAHLVVVLPRGGETTHLNRFPPEIQAITWESSQDTTAVAELAQHRLAGPVPSLRESYAALGQPMSLVRNRLLERAANRPPAPSTEAPRVFPSHVPPSLGDRFAGRARDLWRVDHALSAPGATPIVIIEGAGGVGKTRLAVEYFHRLGPSRFPGGVFWIDAEEDLESQHHRIRDALDPEAGELALAVRSASSNAPMLFIVDNIPEAGPGVQPDPLSRWCPALGSVAVLATSRTRLSAGERATSITLDGLDHEAATQLLATGIESASTMELYRVIAEWVGGLPLALTLLHAAIELGSVSASELARRATGQEGQTTTLDAQVEAVRPHVPSGSLRGVTEALSTSYERLTLDAQDAARLLALLAPTPIPIELVQELDISPSTRASLVARSFVGRSGNGAGENGTELFGSMHRVLGDFLRSIAPVQPSDWTKIYRASAAVVDRALKSRRWHALLAYTPHVLHVLRANPRTDAMSKTLAEVLTFSMAQLALREQPSSELPRYLESLARSQEVRAANEAFDIVEIERLHKQSHLTGLRYKEAVGVLLERMEMLRRADTSPAAVQAAARSMLEAAVEVGRSLGVDRGKSVVELLEAISRFRSSVELLAGGSREPLAALINAAEDVAKAATAILHALDRLAAEISMTLCAAVEASVVVKMSLQEFEEHPLSVRDSLLSSAISEWSHLASGVNELSNELANQGRLEEALVTLRMAIDMRRHLDAIRAPPGSKRSFLVEYEEAYRRILRDLGPSGTPG